MPNVIPCHTSRQHCFCLMLLGVLFHPCKSVPNTMTRCDKQRIMSRTQKETRKRLTWIVDLMEHIVCSFLVFLCGSMTHLRISLRFFFSHLRGWSLDQLGKNSLRMRSKSHNLKIDSKNKNLLQMSQVSPHISTYHLHSDAWYPSKWQNLQSAPWQFKLHPEVSAESRLSILSPLPIRHPDVLKRWNWHLGCGIHILIYLKRCCDLLIFAYLILYWYYALLCFISDLKSNHPIIQFE